MIKINLVNLKRVSMNSLINFLENRKSSRIFSKKELNNEIINTLYNIDYFDDSSKNIQQKINFSYNGYGYIGFVNFEEKEYTIELIQECCSIVSFLPK